MRKEVLTAEELAETKRILAESEGLCRVRAELFDPLFEKGEGVGFARNEILMEPGVMLRDVFILVDGLVGATYMSGSKIVMYGLAIPCTVLVHGGSLFRRRAPMMRWEALVPSRALKIPGSAVLDYIRSSHEFAVWMYGMAENLILHSEERAILLADSAESRYLKLFRNLPRRVFRDLSSRVVSRYLGITEQSLSRIKRQLIEKGKISGENL